MHIVVAGNIGSGKSTLTNRLTGADVYVEDKLFATLDSTTRKLFLDGENIYTQQLTSHGLIVMGNEGNGISEAVRQRVTHRLLIPNFHQGPSAESLNVAIATAITCSEFRRRGTK